VGTHSLTERRVVGKISLVECLRVQLCEALPFLLGDLEVAVHVDEMLEAQLAREAVGSAEGLAGERAALDADQFPIVLAGSCVTCHGVLGGFDHTTCGAVWLDAHADFNTPDTSQSGFFPGMSLAVATGHCFRDYWELIGDSTPLSEDAVAMFGVRDIGPDAERERLERSPIHVVEWRNEKPQDDVNAVLDRLATRVSDVYLHIDFDCFAPDVAPGVADEPVPGGLKFEDAEAIVRATAARFRIKAATLATYTPAHDVDDKTLHLGLQLIALISQTVG
jgi:arginase